MPSAAVASSKDEWRARFRAHREGLSPTTYAAHSTLMCSRALALPAIADASVVHTYWPQTEHGEVDTRPLIGALRGQGVEVILPVVTSYDPATPTMEHHRYEGVHTLQRNRWGILEPTSTDTVAPEVLDAVIVPALGAGRNGHRIGHGSGYYDAFLRTVDVPRIVLTYEKCLAPTVPSNSHDVPVTAIVTERRHLYP